MPPSFRRGKKGKGKGKKKKKKMGGAKAQSPPIHLLTDLYKKLIEAVRTLYEMRVTTRRKRIEGWYLTKEMTEIKNDNALYHDYLTDNIEDLENSIEKFKKLIQEIKEAIAKAVAEKMKKLQKQLDDYEAQYAEVENELQDVRSQLQEYEGMMVELARMLARIQELLLEIEAAKFDALIKIRHLTNQFLAERGRLHNHLEEQLFNLIKFCRGYLMPILWNFMRKLVADNACLRWKLARSDEKNIMLADKREEMMRRRKLLTLEKPYWDIQWAFFKLSQMDAAQKSRKKRRDVLEDKVSRFADIPINQGDVGTVDAVSRLIPSTQLGKDFNVFLVQRLTAAKEAQQRHEKEKRREEKRFLKKLLATAQAIKDGTDVPFDSGEYGQELDVVGEEEEWEDEHEEHQEYYGEDYEEGFDDYGQDYLLEGEE